jgi:hypothetical protein
MVTAQKKAVHHGRPRRKRRSRLIALSVSIIFLLLAIHFWRSAMEASEIVEILYPEAQNAVGWHVTVGGISKGLRGSWYIGVAAYSDGVYFVHYDHTLVASDGSWCSPHVIVGTEGDYDKNFTIIALLMTDEARNELRDYLRNPLRGPLMSLPKQAKVIDEIPVHRRPREVLEGHSSFSSNCQVPPARAAIQGERRIPFALDLLAALASLSGFLLSFAQLALEVFPKLRQILSRVTNHRGPFDAATGRT